MFIVYPEAGGGVAETALGDGSRAIVSSVSQFWSSPLLACIQSI